jgi:uncharacterized protein (TIGR02466 family)
MSITSLFATQIYRSPLRVRGVQALNAQLLREIRQLRLDDAAGRRWAARNYPGGFTSYGSASRLHRLSPTFARLERHLTPHLRAFFAERSNGIWKAMGQRRGARRPRGAVRELASP